MNTTAEVKAESDLCCTSANAAQIVASIPAHRDVLFLPDQFLGAYVKRATGRDNMHIWLGECHVHAGISPADLRRKAAAEPAAELFIHPECGCSTAALWQAGEGDLPPGRTRVLSTGGMLDAARTTTAPAVLVATETGMLHQLRRANPAVRWEPVNPDAVCRYMKMTTPAALLRCLREGIAEVTVAPDVARRARRAVQAMLWSEPELRHLPWSRTHWDREADVVVVGSGAAGMTAALTAARHGRNVLLLSKEEDSAGARRHSPRAAWPPRSVPGTTRACTSGTRSMRAPACAIRPPWRRWPRRPRARSPAWPGVVPGWSERRSISKPGTAASGS